jgi:hypothetical protein
MLLSVGGAVGKKKEDCVLGFALTAEVGNRCLSSSNLEPRTSNDAGSHLHAGMKRSPPGLTDDDSFTQLTVHSSQLAQSLQSLNASSIGHIEMHFLLPGVSYTS